MNGFGIPFLDGGWYGVHGQDSSHEGGRYSSGEVPSKDIQVFYIGPGDMVLEFQDILIQGRGVSLVLLKDYLFDCEPGNSGSSDVSLFKVFIELGDKVYVGS